MIASGMGNITLYNIADVNITADVAVNYYGSCGASGDPQWFAEVLSPFNFSFSISLLVIKQITSRVLLRPLEMFLAYLCLVISAYSLNELITTHLAQLRRITF